MKTISDLFTRLPADGKVRHLFRQFNLAPVQNGKARSVKDLAEILGFSVARRSLPKDMAGRLVTDPFSENGFAIEVNERHSVESQRWTVLHEIGHYFLHSKHSDPLTADMHLVRGSSTFYVNEREEAEANRFAAVLLFGDSALEAVKTLYGGDVAKIARCFGVSEKTICIAIKQFGCS